MVTGRVSALAAMPQCIHERAEIAYCEAICHTRHARSGTKKARSEHDAS